MTKKTNELMAYIYCHFYNTANTGLRFLTVYGPFGRPDMAPMLFAKVMINGKGIKVINHENFEKRLYLCLPNLNEDGIR